ncbi:MAG: hypothetical protein HY920_02800 [Elusimicrobia bacterium]|nr:hypothetical protein [Elusimicrobiota bacterium]
MKKNGNKGISILEISVVVLIAGVLFLVASNFLKMGLISWQRSTTQLQNKTIARESLWSATGTEQNKMAEEIRELINLGEAEACSIGFVVNNNEDFIDVNGNEIFEATDVIVRDSNNDRSYNAGDTVLYNAPAATLGKSLVKFPRDIKHTNNGDYVYDSADSVISDNNDNGYFDVGELVIAGSSPPLGAALVPFGNTIRYYLDHNCLYRTSNTNSPEIISGNIVILDFKYYDRNNMQLFPLPLNSAARNTVYTIEMTIGAGNLNNTNNQAAKNTITLHPRALDGAYGL